MKMKQVNKSWQCWPFFALMLFLAGCNTPEVEVVVDRAYADATIQIDFVKVARGDSRWEMVDVDAYFAPGSPLRKEAKNSNRIYSVFHNVPGRVFKGEIPSDSPVWSRFGIEGSSEPDFDIMVLVDSPIIAAQGGGRIRQRRIPLDKASWDTGLLSRLNPFSDSKLKLKLTITPNGVVLDPAPNTGR